MSASSATLRDVAEHAKLSVSAVWKALADDPAIPDSTKQRVIDASRTLKYKPRPYRQSKRRRAAPGKATRPRRLAMVVVREPAEIGHVSSILQVSEQLAVRVKLEVVLVSESDLAAQRRRVSDAAEGVDGLLLSGFVTAELMQHAGSLGLPAVLIGNLLAQPGEPTDVGVQVGFDFFAMGELATRALWQAGHRRIAFMCVETPPNLWYERWLAGYRAALAERAGAIEPRLTQVTGYVPNQSVNIAAAAFAELDQPPTALVVPDPMLGAQLLDACGQRGLRFDHEAIVIGTTRVDAQRHGVEDRPLICVEPNLLGHACLRVMRAALLGCDLGAARIVLPFDYQNLPGGIGTRRNQSPFTDKQSH